MGATVQDLIYLIGEQAVVIAQLRARLAELERAAAEKSPPVNSE